MNARTTPTLLSLTLLLAACGGGSTPPPGTPVTSLADSGAGSLRAALADAAPGDTLRLTQPGTLTLAAPLVLDKNVTILATGVTVDAAGKGRALEVAQGATVTLRGGTLQGGSGAVLPARLNPAGLAGRFGAAGLEPSARSTQIGAQALNPTYGGVLINSGTLTLDGVTVTGGKANNGGGIYNAKGASLTLKGATSVTGNAGEVTDPADRTAFQGSGGGIFNAGTLTLSGGAVSGNTAVYAGGGLYGDIGSTTTVSGGVLEGNTATFPPTVTSSGVTNGSAGGGLYSNGNVTITGGTIRDNTATYFGGGVCVQSTLDAQGALVVPEVILSGGTVENNRATDDAAGGSGGGLWISGDLTMTGATVRGNSAPYGGGISVLRNGSITGGQIENNEARTKHGGGLLIYTPAARATNSAVTFGGSATVRGNRAAEHSGGILVDRTTFTMTGGTVEGNTALSTGGGLAFGGGTQSAIQGGVIRGNTLTGATDGGGGVRIFGSSALTLSGGEISGNTSPRTGGGITVGGTLTMTGGAITGNTVTDSNEHQGGGGVRLYAGAKMTASGGTISGNKARWGAGVVVDGPFQTSPTSEFTLSGASVTGNTVVDASNNGGAFFNGGKLTITSGSVTGNTATRSGGGVFNTRAAVYAQPGGSVANNAPDNVYTAQ